MSDYQGQPNAGAHDHYDARRDDTRMIAVRNERLATAEDLAGFSGYLPAIPADSEDRSLD